MFAPAQIPNQPLLMTRVLKAHLIKVRNQDKLLAGQLMKRRFYSAAFLFGGSPRIKKRQDGVPPVGAASPTGDIKKRQDIAPPIIHLFKVINQRSTTILISPILNRY
jgi:hypothetical protein